MALRRRYTEVENYRGEEIIHTRKSNEVVRQGNIDSEVARQ